jgi:hypothetical protein
VKADIQVVGDELRVSGLEAATSLIQNAKNLLNAVILTVKSAYIASTKVRIIFIIFHSKFSNNPINNSINIIFSIVARRVQNQALLNGKWQHRKSNH